MSKQSARLPPAGGKQCQRVDRLILAVLSFMLAVFHGSFTASFAQKGMAESDWYPVGYAGDTWAGEVTAFDNEQRTLILTHGSGKNIETFVATIPDLPYQWRRDARNSRVVDFPYDKNRPVQIYRYVGPGFAATILPEDAPAEVRVPNPPTSDVINDFAPFKGRKVVVYYTAREREMNGQKMKYNDVWRILVAHKK